jgi:hypothetical protein
MMNAHLEHLLCRRAAVMTSVLRRHRRNRDIGGLLYAYARVERALYQLGSELDHEAA